MPSAEEVTPNKWTEIEILFDNGSYSIIFGKFEGSKCIGERWNGDKYGYPHQADKPLWHVVPHFLNLAILNKVLDLHLQSSSPSNKGYITSTIEALKFFLDQKKS